MKFTKIKCTIMAIAMLATTVLTAACSIGSQGLKLVSNGASGYVIVCGEKATVSERMAAKELQSYIEQMTGAVLEIVDDSEKAVKKEIIVGKTNREAENEFDRAELGDDGFVIKTKGGKLWLVGGEARGTLYAVYTFLEEYLGCRFYTETVEKVPQTKNITVPHIEEDKQIPVFMYRDMSWYNVSGAGAFTAKLRMNGFYAQPGSAYGSYYLSMPGFVHTFSQIIGGSTKSQPCLTDPKNLERAIGVVGDILATYPSVKIIEISQNDNSNYCTCENCNKVLEEEGSQSGAIIRFVNAIAEEFGERYPDVIFQTLAYSYSQTAPRKTKPAANVTIRLCPIYCCYTHAIDLETNDPERYESVKELLKGEIDVTEDHRTDGLMDAENIVFMEDLRAWSEICDNIAIWQYSINFHRTQLYYPNFNTILKNIRLYADSNVKSVFDQGNYMSDSGDFPELRAYITAKCLWDPYMTEEEYWALIDEFLEAVYGPGWKEIRNYIDNTQKLVEDVCCKCLSFDITDDMRWDDFNCDYLFPFPEAEAVNPAGTYPEELNEEMIRNYENYDWSVYWNWYGKLPDEEPVYLSYSEQCFANAMAMAETDAQRAIIEKTSLQLGFYRSWYNSHKYSSGTGEYLAAIAMLEAYFKDHPGEFTEEEQAYYKDKIDDLAAKQAFGSCIEFNKEYYNLLKKYNVRVIREGKTINFVSNPEEKYDFRIPPDQWF